MTEQKRNRFFIFETKEVGIFLLLGLLVAGFSFTLGIHFGKRIGLHTMLKGKDATAVATEDDQIPDKHDLIEEEKKVDSVAEELLEQRLHQEVAKTGIKMETGRQVSLPEKAKTEETLEQPSTAKKDSHSPADKNGKGLDQALSKTTPEGKYTIQVGSHPALNDANEQVRLLQSLGMEPFVRKARIKNQDWFRVYLGGFDSKPQAQEFGNRYRNQHIIRNFIVSNMP